MIKKIIIFFIIFTYLLLHFIGLKFSSFKVYLKKADQKLLFEKFLNSDITFSLKVVKKFYEKGLFSCLICSLFLRCLLKNQPDIKMKIGSIIENNVYKSHSWIEKSNIVIFGNLDNLKEYKTHLMI